MAAAGMHGEQAMRCLGGALLSAALAASLAHVADAATPRSVPTETIDNQTSSTILDIGGRPGTEGLPSVEYDVSKLPVPVQRLRDQLMDAARSGDIEKLRPVIEANPQIGARLQSDPDDPEISEPITDPVEYLKSQSGDPDGHEILAILLEVLEAGYVHVDIGTPQEMYIWPYFVRYPLEGLSPQQSVELYKIITSGDFDQMRSESGGYSFYRLGISPGGEWQYFETGD